MYKWNNDIILNDLKVYGKDRVLTFETSKEKAIVKLKDDSNWIEYVDHTIYDDSITIEDTIDSFDLTKDEFKIKDVHVKKAKDYIDNMNNVPEWQNKLTGNRTTRYEYYKKLITVGSGNNTRDVYHYLIPSEKYEIRLGLTVHREPGNWSSLPHEFEMNLELDFEEVFFYMIEGGNERAIQIGDGVWCNGQNVNNMWHINNETFSTIPMGYHCVVGEPNSSVSYVWVYICKKPEWEKI
jgi:hypothetical protein